MKDKTIVIHFGVNFYGDPHVRKYEHHYCSDCYGNVQYSFRILEKNFESVKQRLISKYTLERDIDKMSSSIDTSEYEENSSLR